MSKPTNIRTFEHLKIEVLPDAPTIAQRATETVVQTLDRKPNAVICVATGASPAATYERLAGIAAQKPGLFAAVRIVELDEWLGLSPGHEAACSTYLQQRVIRPLGVSPDRFLWFNAAAPSPEQECARVSHALAAWHGIDLALVGIGVNGHIGLNEPGSDPRLFVQVAKLAPHTQEHQMLAAGGIKVARGLTLGLAELGRARRVLILADGARKAHALRNMSMADVQQCPAAYFRTHGQATVLCDPLAAADL